MFPPGVSDELVSLGHDARAAARELRGLTDEQLLDTAVAEGRVLVTENVVDYVALLEARIAARGAVAPVVFVMKASLPAGPGRLSSTLAARLDAWSTDHPEPVPTAYWL